MRNVRKTTKVLANTIRQFHVSILESLSLTLTNIHIYIYQPIIYFYLRTNRASSLSFSLLNKYYIGSPLKNKLKIKTNNICTIVIIWETQGINQSFLHSFIHTPFASSSRPKLKKINKLLNYTIIVIVNAKCAIYIYIQYHIYDIFIYIYIILYFFFCSFISNHLYRLVSCIYIAVTLKISYPESIVPIQSTLVFLPLFTQSNDRSKNTPTSHVRVCMYVCIYVYKNRL